MKLPRTRSWLKVAALAPLLAVMIGAGAVSIAAADPGSGNGDGNAYAYGSADANDHASANDSTASDPNQVPSGSNGVNHNDAAEPANPDCTNSSGTSGTCSSPQPYSTADQNNTGANDTSSSNAYDSTRNGADSDNGSGNGNATGQPCAGCVGKADNKNPQGQAPDGPTDHNNGYECDGNNGIGQTNPAHTGCTAEAGVAQSSTTQSDCDSSMDSSGNANTNDKSDCSSGCSDSASMSGASSSDCTQVNDSTRGENGALVNGRRGGSTGTALFGTNGANTFAGVAGLPAEVLGETLTATPGSSQSGGPGLATFGERAVQPAADVLAATTESVSGEVASPSVGSTLARTGSEFSVLMALAVALLGGGMLLTSFNRRRSQA